MGTCSPRISVTSTPSSPISTRTWTVGLSRRRCASPRRRPRSRYLYDVAAGINEADGLFSVESEGLILPGGDEPEDATVEIPFQSQDEIEKSMSGAVELEWTHALLLSSAADSAPDAVDVGRVGCTARLGVEDSLRQLGPALRHRLLAARGEKVEQVDGERLGRASFVPVESRAPSGARTTGSPQRSLPRSGERQSGQPSRQERGHDEPPRTRGVEAVVERSDSGRRVERIHPSKSDQKIRGRAVPARKAGRSPRLTAARMTFSLTPERRAVGWKVAPSGSFSEKLSRPG